MSSPFVGQLLLASWSYSIRNYAMCNGQLVAISTNQALFAVLGTTYGGNGTTNFALPNLQGRTPVGFGNNVGIGEIAGQETHTLTANEVPAHTHTLQATTTGASLSKPPTSNLLAAAGATLYTGASSLGAMNGSTISFTGGSLPHENRQPYLVMNWLIALIGLFPSRN